MSGVEAAGIVLAVFPLCISALEHYRDTAEVLGFFWKIQREYKKWKHNLDFCRLAFEQNLEEFLLPLIADEDELRNLISDPSGPAWAEPELEERLRERLPKSYELYLESIEHIKDVMIELKKELGIGKAGFQNRVVDNGVISRMKSANGSLDPTVIKANLEYQAQRIRMSFNGSKRDKLFNQLTDYNNELRTLLDTSDRIAALRDARKKPKRSAVSKGLWQFWRHADTLYNILTASWRCDCRSYHLANLMLQHRTTGKADFKVIFVFAQQTLMMRPRSWTLQETSIKMLEGMGSSSKLDAGPSKATEVVCERAPLQTLEAAKNPQKHTSLGFRKSFLKKFKSDKASKQHPPALIPLSLPQPVIIVPQPASIPTIPRVTFTDVSAMPQIVEEASMADVHNLCDTIATYRSNFTTSSCLKGDECRFALSPSKAEGSKPDTSNSVTLQFLLSSESIISLTRCERYFIALTIASSHLQLQSTQWMHSCWNKYHIFFLRDATDPTRIYLDQPYISRDFDTRSDTSSNPDDLNLSSLGIILLELCFGTALEDHPLRKKYSTADQAPNPFLDLAAALEWSSRAVGEAGPEYADAIAWCLRYRQGSGEADSKPGKWREELFVKVVEPLQYCHDQLKKVMR